MQIGKRASELRSRSFDDFSLHFVDGEGLLLDAAGGRLYALNPCATVIWDLLQRGHPPDEVARALADEFAVPAEAAPGYVLDVLRQYETLRSTDRTSAAPPPLAPVVQPVDASALGTYRLVDSVLRVHYGSRALLDRLHPLLAHNAVEAGNGEAVEVLVMDRSGEVMIAVDGRVMGVTPTIETAAVALRAGLTQLAVDRSGAFCAVHAGALAHGGGALLLPGDAGHGKSTLSAGLAARGFAMMSDDTTLLCGDPLQARTMSTGLCVKRGAYPALRQLYPRLASLPEWQRPDGRHARYLVPGIDLPWAPAHAKVPVRWIVFPHYRPDHDTRLEPMARHEALARLIRGVYCLSGALDGPSLDRLIAWIEGIDCYELPLSSLEAGTVLLDELCR